MIHSRVFGSVQSQIEEGAGRADLQFRYVGFLRHVLRDVKTWRGFDASRFGRIFHQWWITVSRACSGLLSGFGGKSDEMRVGFATLKPSIVALFWCDQFGGVRLRGFAGRCVELARLVQWS